MFDAHQPTPIPVAPDAKLPAELLASRASGELLTGREPALPGAVGEDSFLDSLEREEKRGRLRRRPELYVSAVGRLIELVRTGDPLPSPETGVPSDPPPPPLPGRAERAARLLAGFGAAAEPAVPTLLDRLLAVPTEGWRELDGLLTALSALAQIEPPEAADRVRQQIVDRALPRLCEMLASSESGVLETRRGVSDVTYVSLPVGSACVLRALGPAARAAEPALRALAERDAADEYARLSALYALARVAPLTAATVLERRLLPAAPSPDPVGDSWLPRGLVTVLRQLTAPETVPMLVRFLSHQAGMVSHSARMALTKAGPAAAVAVPTLLEQANHWGDERAVETLGALDPTAAAPAVPVLLQLATDTGRPVSMRLAATGALMRLGIAGPMHRALLRHYVRSPRSTIRVECARLLLELRDPPEPMDTVVPILCGLIRQRELAGEALRLLCRVGPQALTLDDRVLPTLQELLADRMEFYSSALLAEAVRELGRLGPALLPTLRELLDNQEDAEVRRGVIAAIAELGRAAEPMLPMLKRLVAESSNDSVADAAEEAIDAIAAASPGPVETLSVGASGDRRTEPLTKN